MSMYMTDTFCSFTRNIIFKSCFLSSEYGSIDENSECSVECDFKYQHTWVLCLIPSMKVGKEMQTTYCNCN